jgi:hypothetical protein
MFPQPANFVAGAIDTLSSERSRRSNGFGKQGKIIGF